MNNVFLKKAMPHLIAGLTFLVLSCAYFFPQLEGKTIVTHDISSFSAASNELRQYKDDTGKTAMWTNSMFSGMPAYQILASSKNALKYVEKFSQLYIQRPIGYFFAAMLLFYILLVAIGISPWLALIGSVGFGFATNSMVLYDAGHMSKLRVLYSAAPAIAGMLLAYRGKYLLGGTIFAASMGVHVYANHYQMTYYLLMTFGIYAIYELVHAIRSKQVKQFGMASAVLALGLLLAVAASASRILTTSEYAADTMRGAPILTENNTDWTSSSMTDGLAWDYAMNWSNSTIDLFSTMIPRAAGGSGGEMIGEDSNLNKNFVGRGIRIGGDFKAPLYYGDLPSTAGPPYLGAALMFLFVLGLVLVQGRVKWWILTAVILTMLLSMGKNFEFFNRLLFDTLPYFNKFRAPSSVLTITSLFIPLLGILGLAQVFKKDGIDQAKVTKGIMIAAGSTSLVCLVLAFGGGALIDFSGNSDASYANIGYDIDALKADRQKYLQADALRSLAFILLTAGALFAYAKGKLGSTVALAATGLLVLVDLWGIDKRYIASDDFMTASQAKNVYQLTDVDREILRDTDPHYRVHDITGDPWNSAARSYHHKTIGGYHAAKLQRYQDVMDYYLYNGNQNVINMLNCKYFILPNQEGGARVQRNVQNYGNAWFIEGIELVENANEEIENLGKIDPRSTAIIHKEFEEFVSGFDPSKNGTIKLTSYAPDRITYETNSLSDQLAVFSEIWYGPNKGWKATIDGQPAQILRANYILRAMNVPAGNHTIEMVFRPAKWYTGEIVSVILSILMVLGLIGALYLEWKKAKDAPEPAPVKKKGKKARSKGK